MKNSPQQQQTDRRSGVKGMTLIELIATVVLAGILATFMLPLVGSGLTGSLQPLLRIPETYSLRAEMDQLWQAYRTVYQDDLEAFWLAIEDEAETADYNLLYNEWVTFNAAGDEVETPGDTGNILRVTIGNDTGERLTVYFSPYTE